jgi:hypothetical protein
MITPDELRQRCRNAHPVDAAIIMQCADGIERLERKLAAERERAEEWKKCAGDLSKWVFGCVPDIEAYRELLAKEETK